MAAGGLAPGDPDPPLPLPPTARGPIARATCAPAEGVLHGAAGVVLVAPAVQATGAAASVDAEELLDGAAGVVLVSPAVQAAGAAVISLGLAAAAGSPTDAGATPPLQVAASASAAPSSAAPATVAAAASAAPSSAAPLAAPGLTPSATPAPPAASAPLAASAPSAAPAGVLKPKASAVTAAPISLAGPATPAASHASLPGAAARAAPSAPRTPADRAARRILRLLDILSMSARAAWRTAARGSAASNAAGEAIAFKSSLIWAISCSSVIPAAISSERVSVVARRTSCLAPMFVVDASTPRGSARIPSSLIHASPFLYDASNALRRRHGVSWLMPSRCSRRLTIMPIVFPERCKSPAHLMITTSQIDPPHRALQWTCHVHESYGTQQRPHR